MLSLKVLCCKFDIVKNHAHFETRNFLSTNVVRVRNMTNCKSGELPLQSAAGLCYIFLTKF